MESGPSMDPNAHSGMAEQSDLGRAPFPTPLPGLREKLALTYDNVAMTDGAGAQLQRIYGIYSVARLLGASYRHSPLAHVGYQGLSALERNEADPDFHSGLNQVFSIESDVLPADNLYDVNLNEISLETVEMLIRKFDSGQSGGKPILAHLLLPYGIADRFPDCYEVCKEISPFSSPVRHNSPLRVSIHVRRGDLLAVARDRMLPNSYFIHVALGVARELDALGIEFQIEINSEVPRSVFTVHPDDHGINHRIAEAVVVDPEECRISEFYVLPNVIFCLNESTTDCIRRLATADVVVMSRSSLSYLGAILNRHGIVLYHPFWHSAPSSWLTVEPEGRFDTRRFNQAF
jgi:hypothetical protein